MDIGGRPLVPDANLFEVGIWLKPTQAKTTTSSAHEERMDRYPYHQQGQGSNLNQGYNGNPPNQLQPRNPAVDNGLRELLAHAASNSFASPLSVAPPGTDFVSRHQQVLAARQQLDRLLLLNMQQAELSGFQLPDGTLR